MHSYVLYDSQKYMKNTKRLFVGYFILLGCLVSFISCGGTRDSQHNISRIDSLSIETKHVLSKDSIFPLQTYYLSCPYYSSVDSFAILGLNSKMHALDIFTSSSIADRIQLEHHGENGILRRPISVYTISKDSIWIYDQIAFYLINSKGKVLHKYTEPKVVFLDSNYAMNTATMGWYDNDILLYPVDCNGKYFIEYYSLKQKKVVKEVPLDFPDCNKDGENSYGDMKYPNVTFACNKIIYNYPYDSSIRTIDVSTGDKKLFEVQSQFVENSLTPYHGAKKTEDWLNYDWSNVHFYEVSYMPQLNLYVRFVLDGINTDNYKDKNTVVDARKLYITFMDNNFEVIGEFPLAEKRYSNFHGWCVLPNAIVIYVDNLLGNFQENLTLDIIRPILKDKLK